MFISCNVSTSWFYILGCFIVSLAACIPFDQWQKSSREFYHQLQCSLKCDAELAGHDGVQLSCDSTCRNVVPRLLANEHKYDENDVSAVLAQCGCTTISSSSHQQQTNNSGLLCERVCISTSNILSQGRLHSGQCPSLAQPGLIEPMLNDQAARGRRKKSPLSQSATSATRLPACRQEAPPCDSDVDCDWSERCCRLPSHCQSVKRVCVKAEQHGSSAAASFKIVSFSLDSDQRVAKFKWVPATLTPNFRAVNSAFVLELKYLVVHPGRNDTTIDDEQFLATEHDRDNSMSPWMVVANATNATSIELDSTVIWPSTWYRFRVLHVSPTATLISSQAVGPVKIARPIRTMSPPQNVSMSSESWLLNADDTQSIDGKLTWLAPLFEDLPVTRYKVTYSQYVPSNVLAILSSPPEYKVSVHGGSTSVTLRRLIPETTYKVDIQAVSRVPRGPKLRSPKSTVFIKTVALDEAADAPGMLLRPSTQQNSVIWTQTQRDNGDAPRQVRDLRVAEVSLSQVGRLEVGVEWTAPVSLSTQTPRVYTLNRDEDEEDDEGDDDDDDDDNNAKTRLMRYIVEWAPLSCIQQEPSQFSSMAQVIRRLSLVTKNTSVLLHTLLPTCFYEVAVTSLNPSNGLRSIKVTQTFRTPVCPSGQCFEALRTTSTTPTTRRTTTVARTTAVARTTGFVDAEGRIVADSRLTQPAPVQNLQFQPVASNGSILVQWSPSADWQAASGFEPLELVFSWSVYPSLEASPGQIRRLNANRSRVIMQNLKPGLLYVVSLVSVARRRVDGQMMRSSPARIVVLLSSTPKPRKASAMTTRKQFVHSPKVTDEHMSAAAAVSSRHRTSSSASSSPSSTFPSWWWSWSAALLCISSSNFITTVF